MNDARRQELLDQAQELYIDMEALYDEYLERMEFIAKQTKLAQNDRKAADRISDAITEIYMEIAKIDEEVMLTLKHYMEKDDNNG